MIGNKLMKGWKNRQTNGWVVNKQR